MRRSVKQRFAVIWMCAFVCAAIPLFVEQTFDSMGSPTRFAAFAAHGFLGLGISTAVPSPIPPPTGNPPLISCDEGFDHRFVFQPEPRSLGFIPLVTAQRKPAGGANAYLWIPSWFALLVPAGMTTRWAVLRSRQTASTNECASCGYPLEEQFEACPECGLKATTAVST